MVRRHVIGDRRRQELRLINLPRSKSGLMSRKESDSSRKCHDYSDTLLEVIKGSIDDRGFVDRAMRDVTHVVHLATCKECLKPLWT